MLYAKFGSNLPSCSGEDFLLFWIEIYFFAIFSAWRRAWPCNIFKIILHFRYYLSLVKAMALHLNKLESPPPKDALCQVWLKLAQWFLRRSWTCEQFTDKQTDGQTTDIRRSEKLSWAFSLGELKWRCFSEISRIECFSSNRYISYSCTHKIPHFKFFTNSF